MLAWRARCLPVPLSLDYKDDLDERLDLDDVEEDFLRGIDLSSVDIDHVDLSVFTNYDSEDECAGALVRETRSHDCMWGGQCCNKESPIQPQRARVPPAPAPASAPKPPVQRAPSKVVTIQKCSASERTENVVVVTNSVKSVRTPARSEGRSLLLNRTTHAQPSQSPVKVPKREPLTPQCSRPETPLSLSESDDELITPIPMDPQHAATSVFRSALDALGAGDAAWHDSVCVFGRTKRDSACAGVRVPSQSDIMRLAKSDHNYDGSGKNISLAGLGVDTPSDSEEEIDVVSLSERSSSSRSSSCSGLPTRPTPRDQEHLEEMTTSLLSASEAVSRKLKKTLIEHSHVYSHKRKKYQSSSSEDEEDEDDDDDEDEELLDYQRYRRQTKRQRQSPSQPRRKKSARFGEEEDSQEKRDLHNNMERMRRIDLRNSFEELKALVPSVANKERAAKVVILKEAANYCDDLGAESQSKYLQLMALKKEQERLRAMVSSLRKAAAMACVKTSKRH